MELNKFLVKAKIAGYASKNGINKKILEDGAKEFRFESNGFKYRDRYYGFNPFIGEEIVWKDNKIIWSMNYFGKIISDLIPPTEVYEFLKIALRQVKEDKAFRGPDNVKSGDFEYINKSVNNNNTFSGIEKIIFKRQEIYRLNYHGGLM